MRVLGIETSSRRGSVALVENGNVVRSEDYEELHAHAERMLPLVTRLMLDTGWTRDSLDRIAIGTGPGSFTGLRVGIALAQGIATGLQIPLLGVGSLQAMAHGARGTAAPIRCSILDARRNEVFVAAYRANMTEALPPTAVSREAISDLLASIGTTADEIIALGEYARTLSLPCATFTSHESDLPHASQAALLSEIVPPSHASTRPVYVRDADAKLPNLPLSPLKRPRG